MLSQDPQGLTLSFNPSLLTEGMRGCKRCLNLQHLYLVTSVGVSIRGHTRYQ